MLVQKRNLVLNSSLVQLLRVSVLHVVYPLGFCFGFTLISGRRIRTEIMPCPTENLRRKHKHLEVVEFVGSIDFELAMYFVQNTAILEKIIIDCRPGYLGPWAREGLKEDESSMGLRKHALDLKKKLPLGVQLIVCPPQI
ncbi:hypothetical protein U1Q18_015724 [Sarracenia purpurea var. burkii]